jgi:mRNA-degrading endonuclease RelE of RelBE toxin-antitoxin system
MAHEIIQMRRFARQYKKLNDNTAKDVDEAVIQVSKKPSLGDKKGDLSALRVYKFKSKSQIYLLGYTVNDSLRLIYLESIGPHENFYRDLKG